MIENKEFNSEGFISRIFGEVTILILIVLGFGFVVFGNWKGLLFGSILVILCIILLGYGFYKIQFENDYFTVKRKFREDKVDYLQIVSFYKNREGFAPIYIYVIKFEKSNGGKGKVTFDATEAEAERILERINAFKPDIYLWVKE
ncbi:MAG: hypothetical protein ACOYLH_03050 [Flavobacteriales bacterium]